MPSPQEEQVNANIDLLLACHFDGMDPIAQQNLQDSMEDIRAEYHKVAALAKSDKYYKDVGESIAKSLPSLVKGVYSAAQAFKSGDYISGAAAIMDICASIIPVFAAVLSATGPQGAIIGALFSVVGQILSFFMPKQPSMESKIQKMLDQLQSETQLANIKAFGHSVSSYTSSMRTKCMGIHKLEKPTALAGKVSLTVGSQNVSGTDTAFNTTTAVGQWLSFDADTTGTVYKIEAIANATSLTLSTPYNGAAAAASTLKQLVRTTERRSIDEILAMPLNTEKQANDFIVEMKALQWGLEKVNTKLDTPVFANWQVAGYLESPESQSKEGWPEVLGTWCQTYIYLLTANMMLSCLADPKTLDTLLAETGEENSQSTLPPNAKKKCQSTLLNLKSLVIGLRRSWESDNKEMLKIVSKLRSVARERGLYAHLGYWKNGNILYVASGNGKAEPLKWNYKKNTAWLKTISIYLPNSQKDSYTPKYELLALEDGDRVHLHTVNSITGHLSNGTVVINPRPNERFYDVSGFPLNEDQIGIDHNAKPVTLASLAIERNSDYQYLNYYTINKELKSARVDYEPYLGGIRDIRSLNLPATTLPGDPDADAMTDANATPPGPPLLSQKTAVTYGGVRDRNHVHVLAWNSWDTVEGPKDWTGYNGIEVDPYYVWVFGKGGIACATHASMIKARQGKIKRPSWVYLDFDKQFSAPEVISLCPSADGTLVVCMLNEIYTADYKIDQKTSRVVTSSWVKRRGNGKQVIKIPIPCWSVLESLKANLQSE